MIEVICNDARKALEDIPENSISCIVTSPPYYGLRDYGSDDQIGLEKTPEEYIQKLVGIFHEAKRTLREDGTLWINIGDSYAGSGKGAAHYPECTKGKLQSTSRGMLGANVPTGITPEGCKPKDLIGIPWMLAFALRSDGWYLRQDIIWQKPNAMPESVKDRYTNDYEHILLLSKNRKYYFDGEAIAEPIAASTAIRLSGNIENQKGSDRGNGGTRTMKAAPPRFGGNKYTKEPDAFFRTKSGNIYNYKAKRNKRAVWSIPTNQCREMHFATFPKEIVRTCILAGCRMGETILDPFGGSGTTGIVANELGCNAILIELNPIYADMCRRNTAQTSIADYL